MGTLRLGWRGGREEERRGNHKDREGASATGVQKSLKAMPSSLDFTMGKMKSHWMISVTKVT